MKGISLRVCRLDGGGVVFIDYFFFFPRGRLAWQLFWLARFAFLTHRLPVFLRSLLCFLFLPECIVGIIIFYEVEFHSRHLGRCIVFEGDGGRPDRNNFYGCNSLREHAQGLGRSPGEVDDSASSERTAIGHPHHYLFTIREVFHFEQGAEGMCAVGACQAVVMQPFAAAGACTRCPPRIKRGFTPLLCIQRDKACCEE